MRGGSEAAHLGRVWCMVIALVIIAILLCTRAAFDDFGAELIVLIFL